MTYDTIDEDDAKLGVQLGCNGIVHTLFEPIAVGRCAVALLKRLTAEREAAVPVTPFLANHPLNPERCCCIAGGEKISSVPESLSKEAEADAHKILANRCAFAQPYSVNKLNTRLLLNSFRHPLP